ncbi:MAG: hypothetical protein IT379_20710 [Deltaproteobacteria bacterium]|nr:hypothetical protein [Deltaproteobacteria bacterium]
MVALGCLLCSGPSPASRVLRYDLADVALRFGIYAAVLLVVVTIASLGAAAVGWLALGAISAVLGFGIFVAGGIALARRRRERHAFYLVLAEDRLVLGAGEHRRDVPWRDVTGVSYDDDDRTLVLERANDAKALEIPVWLEGASTAELRDAIAAAWASASKTAAAPPSSRPIDGSTQDDANATSST